MILARNTPPPVSALERFAGRDLWQPPTAQDWQMVFGEDSPKGILLALLDALAMDRKLAAPVGYDSPER